MFLEDTCFAPGSVLYNPIRKASVWVKFLQQLFLAAKFTGLDPGRYDHLMNGPRPVLSSADCPTALAVWAIPDCPIRPNTVFVVLLNGLIVAAFMTIRWRNISSVSNDVSFGGFHAPIFTPFIFASLAVFARPRRGLGHQPTPSV
jgi:hypothetical protein